MAGSTRFDVKAGLPFARRVRITDGKNIWTDEGDFEARMQIRAVDRADGALRFDFTPFLSQSIDANDILIEWNLSGSQTRELKEGYYDLMISDVGEIDTKAIRVLYGYVNVIPAMTSGGGTS